MKIPPDRTTQQRRFLAIYFRVGTSENGYLVGPALVSTGDYAHFHFWDEAPAAELDTDGYEIIKLYPRGMTFDEASRQFAKDFAALLNGPQATRWRLPSQATSDQQGWTDRRVISA